MDFFLNDDEQMIQEVVRDFAQSELKPNAARLDQDHQMDLANLKKMAELGFMGMNIPEPYGGAEVGVVPYSLGMIEVGRACAATAVSAVTKIVAPVSTPIAPGVVSSPSETESTIEGIIASAALSREASTTKTTIV
jgi:alkylation response protein AidB-like acyl-CoA dehydrogenase